MRTSEAGEGSGYRFGLICLVSATVFTSLAGVLLRHVEDAGGWQVVFYRSLAFVAAMGLFVAWRHRERAVRAFRGIGRPGLGVAMFLGAAFVLFIFALLETTVANVVFTISLAPFFAALFARAVLGERVRPATMGIMAVALAGVGFMFADGFVGGTWRGNLLAFACCLCYSAGLVAMRGGRANDMMPALCLAGVLAAAIAGAMADGLAIGRHDLAIAVTLGVVQLALQYMLVATGMRHVPAAEAALVGRLALILAPLWVWLAVGEAPGRLTLIGGAVVLGALTTHGVFALRRESRPTPTA